MHHIIIEKQPSLLVQLSINLTFLFLKKS